MPDPVCNNDLASTNLFPPHRFMKHWAVVFEYLVSENGEIDKREIFEATDVDGLLFAHNKAFGRLDENYWRQCKGKL